MNPTATETYEVADTILAQIGRMNVLAISGGRVGRHPDGVTLPVSNGYAVIVTLDGNDTYTVTRTWRKTIKGQVSGIYCDQVGEVAYRASCFHDEF